MDDLQETVRESLHKLPQDIVVLLRRQNLLRSLVQRMVIDQACTAVQLPAEKLDQAIASFCEQHGLSDEERLERYLSHQGLIKPDLIHQLGIPLKVQYLSLKEFSAKAEAHFLKRKEELDQFTYSLLRVEDSDLAHELYLQIEAGEADFTVLATEHSQGRERASHGLVGPASLGRAHPLLRQRLRTATPGVLLEPFKIEQWWVVTRLEERQLATFDSNMQKRMAIELFDGWIEQQTNQLISAVRGDQFENGALT